MLDRKLMKIFAKPCLYLIVSLFFLFRGHGEEVVALPVDAEVVFRGEVNEESLFTPEARRTWGIPWVSRADAVGVLEGTDGRCG
ncbi:MAG: hypothetical protein WD708_04050 [Kiritimatiellia bacterium]